MTDSRLAALQAMLHREVPLSAHMGVTATAYDGQVLELSAELEPNINIHGTAFGGSLYALAALSGWALLRLRLEDHSLHAEVVLGSAHIDYQAPVRATLAARATCAANDFGAFAGRVHNSRRASVAVSVDLYSVSDGQRLEAARFEGFFATV